MKQLVNKIFVLSAFAFFIFQVTGCKKDSPQTSNNYPIQGLWEGTYTVGAGYPVPAGTSFYFSLSIYPGGKVSYKSKGYYNGSLDYITFADGTWVLNGTSFTYNVTTVNYAGGLPQQTQIGSAIYNSSNGTLTNGTMTGSNATWAMTRVN